MPHLPDADSQRIFRFFGPMGVAGHVGSHVHPSVYMASLLIEDMQIDPDLF
jgi:hypothetical protein